jgi:hypothetical protein
MANEQSKNDKCVCANGPCSFESSRKKKGVLFLSIFFGDNLLLSMMMLSKMVLSSMMLKMLPPKTKMV